MSLEMKLLLGRNRLTSQGLPELSGFWMTDNNAQARVGPVQTTLLLQHTWVDSLASFIVPALAGTICYVGSCASVDSLQREDMIPIFPEV